MMSDAATTVTMSDITDTEKTSAFDMTCTKPSAWHQEAGDAIAYNIIRAFQRKVTMEDEITMEELIKHVGITWINQKKHFVVHAPPVITIFILSLQGRSLEVTTQDGVVYTLKAKNYDGPTVDGKQKVTETHGPRSTGVHLILRAG